MTIKEIQKIQASHISIPTHDVSASVRTTNKNITQIKFDNFDKEYNEKLMPKDITDAILSLNNKSLPMFVRDIKTYNDIKKYCFRKRKTAIFKQFYCFVD